MEDIRFGRNAARQIQDTVRAEERTRRFSKPDVSGSASYVAYIAMTPAGGIPARSGTTPGSATCTLWYINGSDTLQVITNVDSKQRTETVWNICSSAVAGNTYIQIKQDAFGRYLVDVEDC